MSRRTAQVAAGSAVIGAALLCAALGARLAPHDPLRYDARSTLRAPSPAHPLGTDPLGRDVLSQVISGARV
jgi:peptide/nickel transport system permease protein